MLKVEYVPIQSIKPYERNARKHQDYDVDAIAASIQEFGFDDPIGIWKDEIVEGHGRLMAAKKLGMTEVPIIRLDHLTDEQRKAYALAHNKTAELSSWDLELQGLELADITDIDMSLFGFDISKDNFSFDESDLDSTEIRENVIVSLNCGSVKAYETIKDRMQELCDEIGGTLAVKMQ